MKWYVEFILQLYTAIANLKKKIFDNNLLTKNNLKWSIRKSEREHWCGFSLEEASLLVQFSLKSGVSLNPWQP